MRGALSQAWPPFALIVGLLLIGLSASRDGLFRWGGGRLRRLPGGRSGLFVGGLFLVALVTAVLNLDTAVVFLTPVMLVAAGERGPAAEPFLYGTVFMANASSLFLPGSNLTNLLVLSDHDVSGSRFAASIFPEAITATVVTAVGLLLVYRRRLGRFDAAPTVARGDLRRPNLGPGLVATVAATAVILFASHPALPVLVIGALATAYASARGRVALREVVAVVGPFSLGAAFVLTVALGTLARSWDGPAEALAGADAWGTAAIAALTAVAINNLPAAALYSAHHVAHPRALLLGLNVGPNLAATGALSALLWYRTAIAAGARPSLLEFSRRGVVLAPAAIAAALLVRGMY